MEELLYKELTYDIRGACFWVYKEFGGAFKEKVIERALILELQKRKHDVEAQKEIGIYYLGKKIGSYIPDLIVDEKVLVELKSKEFITKQDIEQFWKYLKGSQFKVGLLVNFGPKELEIKRVVYDIAREKQSNKQRLSTVKATNVTNPRQDPRSRSASDQRPKGFTLVEMIIYIAIIGIVITGFINYSLSVGGVRNKNYSAATVQANGREALSVLTQKIHEASAVLTPSAGATNTQLVLDMPGANPNIIFDVSGGILTMTPTGSPAVTITDSRATISSLTFTNLASSGQRPNIQIDMTINYTTPAGDVQTGYTKTYRTAVSTRP